MRLTSEVTTAVTEAAADITGSATHTAVNKHK